MGLATFVAFFVALACGLFCLYQQRREKIFVLAQMLFFLLWTAFTVLVSLYLFTHWLKPTVEIKYHTSSLYQRLEKESQDDHV